MVQCTGCGQAVSEWAARCPGCRRSTADAEVITDEDTGPAPEVIPATDDSPEAAVSRDVEGQGDSPLGEAATEGEADEVEGIQDFEPFSPFEPAASGGGRRPPSRRWVAAALVAVVAAGVGAGVSVDHSGRQSRSTAAGLAGIGSLTGDVVAVDPHGPIVLSNPTGGGASPEPGLGASPDHPVAVAPDGRYLIGYGGRVVRLGPRGSITSAVSLPVPSGGALALPDPFADQDRAVVILRRADARGDMTVSVVPLGGRPATVLGRVDGTSVAGDPRTVGVFAAVSASLQPTAPRGLVDRIVELHDAGHASVILATAAALNRALRQPPDTPVHLAVYPSPTGDRVAVVVEPPVGPGTAGGAGGLVVLDRRGRVVAALTAIDGGPADYVAPTWSPDGRQLGYPSLIREGPEIGLLAYPSDSQLDPAIAVWGLRKSVNVRQAPDPGVELGACVWSPDGSAIVCPAARAQGAEWVLGRQAGSLVAVPDGATPVAWLASK